MDIKSKLLARIDALEKENERLKYSAANAEATALSLQESQVMFKTVFESSRLGNKIISSDLTILEINPALVTLLGYANKEEIIGTKILDYTPEDSRRDWTVLQEKLWQRATPSFSLETCLLTRTGKLLWCQVTSILFADRGETLGYTIIEDITEQHELRLQKEQFISVASHELKTPITSLKATLQLLNKFLKIEGPITEKLLKLGKDADRHITKLTHLVNDLLNSTKIEQGQLSLNKTQFVLSDIIDGCCTHISLDGKHHIVFEGNHSVEVFADEQKIDQVLVNLINNAVKYAPKSEKIIVRVDKVEGHTKVSVIDHGDGIAEENISKLFDRYFRINQHSYTPGLGLGLFISAEIIRRHNGKIGAESVLGEGACFWFTIPDQPLNEK